MKNHKIKKIEIPIFLKSGSTLAETWYVIDMCEIWLERVKGS